MVITSKIIKVKSAGRFTRSTGIAIIGPHQSFYKEKVSEIGYLLKKYPNIKIVEKIEDGRLVNLTLANYDKNNNVKSGPVSVETPDKQEEAPPYNGEKITSGVNTTSEALSQYETEEPKGEDVPPEQTEDVAPDKQEEAPPYNNNTNNQQYGGKKNKNKNNKNGQQQANKSTEVVPEEPTM
ncbi:hypothetical protein [Bacteroides acidifaciens]|uniref:hypothetical protein n=1 Tax=Bacteroides acidifaciens TaxID=85831 RepID=UPI0026E980A8|nr:hypothetical protein [Bacteroides acidifaciens]